MKLATMITMAVMMAAGAQGKTEATRQITVYTSASVDVPFTVKIQAEHLASEMFSSIGVKVDWRIGQPKPSETDAIAIEFAASTAANAPGILAYAMPYEGVHIRVFWNRIASDPSPREVLAHVMVHEITHILQGVARH